MAIYDAYNREIEYVGESRDPVIADLRLENEYLKERFAQLEMAMEEQGWWRLNNDGKDDEFTRDFLRQLVSLARLYSIKNPMVLRAVEIQALYVWALGCAFECDDDLVEELVNEFLARPVNAPILGTQEARMQLEKDQRVEGNLFFLFFPNQTTGEVAVRLLPFDQVTEIITNPEDCLDPWYYKRVYTPTEGATIVQYHPCFRYVPPSRYQPFGDGSVVWDQPVYHTKTGGSRNMRFGVPEVYAMLDWAKIYKEILEDFTTVLRAYARIAMQIKGIKKSNQAASKSQMGTNVTSNDLVERHPSAVTGATMLTSQGVEIQAVKTAGATTSPDEFEPVRLQIAAAAGLPGTFFGNVDVGNFATAQTLDRPTELKMIGRQEFWRTVFGNIIDFVVYWSAKAPRGKLRQAGWEVNRYEDSNGSYVFESVPPGGAKAKPIDIRFPSIVERNMVERVRSLVGAYTMLGNPLAGVIPDKKYMAKLLLEAIGEKNVDAILEKWDAEKVWDEIPDPLQAQLDNKIDVAKQTAKAFNQQPAAKPNGGIQ